MIAEMTNPVDLAEFLFEEFACKIYTGNFYKNAMQGKAMNIWNKASDTKDIDIVMLIDQVLKEE